jgi:nucleoside-diphosphate-sugar epimerase
MPAVVVTGAAGFIGRRVVARLVEDGAGVVAVDRLPDPGGWPEGVEYRRVDLGQDMLGMAEPWILVHLAWNMERGDSGAQSASVNEFARLLGQENLAGVAGLGSAEEYGELAGCLREDMAPGRNLSTYGQAKQVACRALAAWAGTGKRKAVWLRPFVVYGPGQGGNMAIPYALRCAKERQPAEFSEGNQQRDFVHVDDVADGIALAALSLPDLAEPFAVCNLGRGEPVRLRDVLERIAAATQARELFRFGARPMRPGEPQEQFADISAAATLLKWRARTGWPEGIDRLCRESLR